MAQANNIRVDISTDGVNWSTIYSISPVSAGVSSDFFHYVPSAPGAYYFRVVATDNNGFAVGRTSIIAMAANR